MAGCQKRQRQSKLTYINTHARKMIETRVLHEDGDDGNIGLCRVTRVTRVLDSKLESSNICLLEYAVVNK